MTDSRSPRRKTLHTIHKALPNMTGAALAELRRLRPEDPSSTTFWKIVALYLRPHMVKGGPLRDKQERRWAAALNALALLHEFHTPGAGLGQPLAEANFSELRFTRLIQARGEQLYGEVRRAAGLIASKGHRADAAEFLMLLLYQEGPYMESIRRQIARDYFFHAHSMEK
ncbi:MAG: type I-E CRISPR-associated protein Cse2/CasB [Myxococcota bacterium]